MSWISRVIRAALLLAACVGLPIAANAGDWTVTSSVGETIEANSNPQLESKSPGGAVGSITNLSLQAIDDMPTLHWETDANLGFSGFWGPGALGSLDGVNGVARTLIAKSTPLTDYHASFSASVLPASVSQVFDSGITNANTTTFTYSGEGGLLHQVNALNAIGLSVSGSSESFTGDNGSRTPFTSLAGTSLNFTNGNGGLTPYTYLTTGQSWIHNVTPRTNLTVASSTAWYGADGAASIDSLSESVTGQVQTQLSERLSFTAGGGGDVVRTTGSSDSTLAGFIPNSTFTGFIADAALTYALKNTSVSAVASHNLAPSSLGSLQEQTQVGLSVAHQINEWSNVLFSGIFLDQVPITSIQADPNQTQRQALVLSAGYHRNLIRNWDLGVTYNFIEQNNGDNGFIPRFNDNGSANSNAVFVSFKRNFTLLASGGAQVMPSVGGAQGSPSVGGPQGLPSLGDPVVLPPYHNPITIDR